MDARKEYEKNQKKERLEQAIARLSKPYRIHTLPFIYVALWAFFDVMTGSATFEAILKSISDPVFLSAIVIIVAAGIKFDKDSQNFYRVLCSPLEMVYSGTLKELDYIRTKTGFAIVLTCVAAYMYLLFFTDNYNNICTCFFLLGFYVWQCIKDSEFALNAIENDANEIISDENQ